jgi:hypothetical protein
LAKSKKSGEKLPWGQRTETIDQRTIWVYLPSLPMKAIWVDRAEKMRVSVSKFIIEMVENAIREEHETGYPERKKLIDKVKELELENSKLREENRLFRNLSDRLDKDLKRYRGESFMDEGFEGRRRYDAQLVELLKSKKVIKTDEILNALKISPRDTDIVKSVTKQLETLESYGLIKYKINSWEWLRGDYP